MKTPMRYKITHFGAGWSVWDTVNDVCAKAGIATAQEAAKIAIEMQGEHENKIRNECANGET